MRRFGIPVLLLTAFCAVLWAWQSSASESNAAQNAPRFGVIDLDAVQNKAVPVKQMIDNASSAIDGLSKQLDAKYTELGELREQAKGSSVLSDESKQQLAARTTKLTDEITDLESRINAEMSKSYNRIAADSLPLIGKAIAAVAQSGGYTMVARSDAIVYADPSCDITQQVIDVLNAGASK